MGLEDEWVQGRCHYSSRAVCECSGSGKRAAPRGPKTASGTLFEASAFQERALPPRRCAQEISVST